MPNPNDPGMPLSGKALVDALADQWGTLFAVLMKKLGQLDITITPADIEAIANDRSTPTLVPGPGAEPRDIRIRLMPMQEALRLARENKGGFGKS